MISIVISTLVKIGKTRNCVKTLRPSGVVFPHNFSFFQFPLVLIYLYINTENVLYFLNITNICIGVFSFPRRKREKKVRLTLRFNRNSMFCCQYVQIPPVYAIFIGLSCSVGYHRKFNFNLRYAMHAWISCINSGFDALFMTY